jgi:hypothetical protein
MSLLTAVLGLLGFLDGNKGWDMGQHRPRPTSIADRAVMNVNRAILYLGCFSLGVMRVKHVRYVTRQSDRRH